MKKQKNWCNKKARKRTLMFGNSISCPSVTMVKEKVGNQPYDEKYICNCDYKTWINYLNYDGDYVYIPKILMSH